MNGLWLLAIELHAQPIAMCRNRQLAVTELADQIERLLRRALEREPPSVFSDRVFDGLAHLRRCAEVPVGRRQSVERLVGSMKVVMVDEEPQPPLAIDEVSKHRALEKLIP